MTAREEVERLLAKHQARFHYAGPRTRTTCAAPGCAWECRGDGGRQHLAHVAQVLDEAGLLAEPEAEVRADERRRVRVKARLGWPVDPYYDLRAFQKVGIEDPVSLGLCELESKPLREEYREYA